MKTIAQISTPLGSGGVSIIRMSGDNSKQIAFKFFKSGTVNIETIEPRKMYLGTFSYNEITERCLLVWFKAPYSFTGEDVVEFQIHGGEHLAHVILSALLSGGAVLAENGEFSKISFMNGKMSLDEAEGMIDMINATSDAELKASSKLAKGALVQTISKMQKDLEDCLVDLEVSIDYPEHNDELITTNQVENVLKENQKILNELIKTTTSGKTIKYGVNVAIVGKPNVGKSSVLNALLGEERAIVTNIKGTTRDVLKETIVYNGIKINFLDTAGVRESSDVVEKIGIEKSLETIKQADIVLVVLDASEQLDEEDEAILNLVKNQPHLIILNKSDLPQKLQIEKAITISALNNVNINTIKQEILNTVSAEKIDYSQMIITNERHAEILKQADKKFTEIIEMCKTQPVDILDMEIKFLWQILGKITGVSETENIIDSIFKKFCLGK